jgi:hypothetical protein
MGLRLREGSHSGKTWRREDLERGLNRTTSVDYVSSQRIELDLPRMGPRTYGTYGQFAPARFVIAARGNLRRYADTPTRRHASCVALEFLYQFSADTKLGRLISGNSGTVKVRS